MKSFTISPPPGDPPVLQNNTGKITFTVTNTATRTVEGTVLVKPQPPAEESWFTFPEGATRTYQPGAVQSVSTTVTAPPGTPAGTYTFRLDAKNEALTDEDYTEGPLTQFVLAEAPKPPPWWKRYWWIFVIVAVVLIGIGIAVLLLRGGDDDEAAIPERDCVVIDAGSLQSTPSPIFNIPRFNVTATGVNLGRYATQQDADRVIGLAQAFNRRCVIGTVEYWLDETGQPLPEPLDCFGYDQDEVEAVPSGSRFVVRDPQVTRPLGTVSSQQDANDLKAVAEEFTTRCFIGQGQEDDGAIKEFLDTDRGKDFRLGGGNLQQLFRTSVMDYWVK